MVKFKGNNTFVVSESVTRQKTELHILLQARDSWGVKLKSPPKLQLLTGAPSRTRS